MDSLISLAERRLLTPGGLASTDLDRVFSQLMGPSIDAADLYFQHSRSESWVLEEGIVKDGSHSIEQGVGVRAISGEKTGTSMSSQPGNATASRSIASVSAVRWTRARRPWRSVVSQPADALRASAWRAACVL